MLYLEKFREIWTLALFLVLLAGSSMKTGKWSLMSDTITPDNISGAGLLVSIWSISEEDRLCILVTFSIH